MEQRFSKTSNNVVITLLIAEAIVVTIPVIILGKFFNFPDILRQPAENAFELFRVNHSQIIIGYYIFLISSLLYIPLSYSIKNLFYTSENHVLLKAFTSLGVITAIFQTIGFVRWIFTMPYLTETYFAQPENKPTITIIYEMLNRYAGMSIGEHLGFIAMGSWTIVLGILFIKYLERNKWVGYLGCIVGVLLVLSVGEHFGGQYSQLLGTINFIANSVWTLWLIALVIVLFKTRQKNSF